MTTSLIARQLPAFIEDCLGTVNFGPKLKTHQSGVMNFAGHELTLEEVWMIGKDDNNVQKITGQLLDSIKRADPKMLTNKRRSTLIGRVWNSLTGSHDVQLIEFSLHSRKVEKLAELSPAILDQSRKSLAILSLLDDVYKSDIETLTEYIREANEFIETFLTRKHEITKQEEYGIDRLRQRIVNMTVTLNATQADRIKVDVLLHSNILKIDRLVDCIQSVIPVWRQLIKSARNGVDDIVIDEELDNRLKALVNKVNQSTSKGNR